MLCTISLDEECCQWSWMFPIHCVLESVSLPGQISDLMTPRPAPPTPNLDQLLWQQLCVLSPITRTKPRKTITVTLPRPSLHQQYQISAKRLMRMCNNRLLDLQDTSLEVTPDTAGNISSQSFLLNLQYSLRVTFNILTSSPGDAAPTQRPYSHRIIGSSM